jgi:hypothetical protein
VQSALICGATRHGGRQPRRGGTTDRRGRYKPCTPLRVPTPRAHNHPTATPPRARRAAGMSQMLSPICATCATRLGDRGASAFEIPQIMGWSDIRMAMRYTHATGDGIRRAMQLLTQTGVISRLLNIYPRPPRILGTAGKFHCWLLETAMLRDIVRKVGSQTLQTLNNRQS